MKTRIGEFFEKNDYFGIDELRGHDIAGERSWASGAGKAIGAIAKGAVKKKKKSSLYGKLVHAITGRHPR